MRCLVHAVVITSLAVGAVLVAQGQRGGDATQALAATRQALGGEEKLAAVKSFVATGRTRQVRGNNLVPIEFEIVCELPDKYVRRDEIPAQETGLTSSGFNGEVLIQVPPMPEPPAQIGRPVGAPAANPAPGAASATGAKPPAPPPAAGTTPPAAGTTPPAGAATPPAAAGAAAPGAAAFQSLAPAPGLAGGPPSGRAGGPPVPPPDPRKARVTSIKQDFVRLTLGMFATSFSSYPLTFTLGGQAEAPQGKADIIDVKGPGNFTARFLVNDETHLPIMVSWTMPATNVVLVVAGQPAPENLPPGSIKVGAPAPPPPTASKEEQAKYAKDLQDLRMKALKSAEPVEYRIYYADYRDIGNGIKFPFRLRRAIGTDTVEETNFDTYKINTRIDARKFEVVK